MTLVTNELVGFMESLMLLTIVIVEVNPCTNVACKFLGSPMSLFDVKMEPASSPEAFVADMAGKIGLLMRRRNMENQGIPSNVALVTNVALVRFRIILVLLSCVNLEHS